MSAVWQPAPDGVGLDGGEILRSSLEHRYLLRGSEDDRVAFRIGGPLGLPCLQSLPDRTRVRHRETIAHGRKILGLVDVDEETREAINGASALATLRGVRDARVAEGAREGGPREAVLAALHYRRLEILEERS